MRKRFWIGLLGLLIAFLGARPWLEYNFLDFIPKEGSFYSGIIFIFGAIIFLWELFKGGY